MGGVERTTSTEAEQTTTTMGGVERTTSTKGEQTTTSATEAQTPTQTTSEAPCFLVDGMSNAQVTIKLLSNMSFYNINLLISRLFHQKT